LERARSRNDGRDGLEIPEHGRLDLGYEVDRLTPHWEEFLAFLSELSRRREGGDVSLRTSSRQWSMASSSVFATLFSDRVRTATLLWIDVDGLYWLDWFEGAEGTRLGELSGKETIELPRPTTRGRLDLVLLTFEDQPTPTARPSSTYPEKGSKPRIPMPWRICASCAISCSPKPSRET